MFAYRVHEKEAVILERNRKFHSVVTESGLHGKMPGKLLKIAARVSLGIKPLADNLQTKTKDNMFVTIPTTVHMKVIDAKLWHYAANGNQSSDEQAKTLILQSVKQLVANMQFEQLYEGTDKLGASVSDQVGKTLEERYGLKIVDVIIDQPQVASDVESDFNSTRSSVQTAQARVNAAQANRDATILEAQAHKQEMQLDGEGLAAQRTAVLSNFTEQARELADKLNVTPERALDVTMQMMQLDTLREAAKSGNLIITTLNSKDSPLIDAQAAIQTALKAAAKKDEQPAQQNRNPAAKPPQP